MNKRGEGERHTILCAYPEEAERRPFACVSWTGRAGRRRELMRRDATDRGLFVGTRVRVEFKETKLVPGFDSPNRGVSAQALVGPSIPIYYGVPQSK
jgi:hypothetical protein